MGRRGKRVSVIAAMYGCCPETGVCPSPTVCADAGVLTTAGVF